MIHSFITSLLMYPYFNQYPYLTTLTHYHQHPTINSHFPPLLTTKLQASMSSKKTPNGLCSYPYLLKSFDSIHSFSLFQKAIVAFKPGDCFYASSESYYPFESSGLFCYVKIYFGAVMLQGNDLNLYHCWVLVDPAQLYFVISKQWIFAIFC